MADVAKRSGGGVKCKEDRASEWACRRIISTPPLRSTAHSRTLYRAASAKATIWKLAGDLKEAPWRAVLRPQPTAIVFARAPQHHTD